jgi:predicted DsbA family dithiol-disulfide isomerase
VTRSFELDPTADPEPVPLAAYMAKRMGMSEAEALQLQDQMAPLAEQEGLPYKADRVHANSFDAHRVLQLATSTGVGPRYLRELQHGLFSGRPDAYDHAFFIETAEGVGIPKERAAQVLDSDEFGDTVRQDEAEARQLGVTGVPFTVVDGRYGLPGAVPLAAFSQVIEDVWNERG